MWQVFFLLHLGQVSMQLLGVDNFFQLEILWSVSSRKYLSTSENID